MVRLIPRKEMKNTKMYFLERILESNSSGLLIFGQ